VLRAGITAAAALPWAAACGRGATPAGPASTSEPVTLVLWEAHSPQMTGATQAQRARFHEQVPPTTVDQQKVVFGDNYEKLTAAVAAGTAPDIAPIWSGLLAQFASQGAILSLDQYGARAVARDLFPAVVEYVQYQGKLWGLPYSMSPRFYVYNTTLFAAAGIGAAPRTWDALAEAGRKLTTPQVGGFSTPTSGEGLVDHFSLLLWQGGGDFFDKSTTRATFAGPEGQAALQFLVDVARKYRLLPPAGATDERTTFLQGGSASYIDGPWIFDERNRVAPDLQYDVAEPPRPPNGHPATYASTGAYAVFGTTKHPKEAADFVKFVSSKEGQAILVHSYKGPARGDIYDEPDVKALLRDTPQVLITRTVGAYARIWPPLAEWGAMSQQAFQPQLAAAMTEATSVKAALDEAARVTDSILATRRR
jgi:ABC-type glycerol-3-phosphate transport system substrate-binding protein